MTKKTKEENLEKFDAPAEDAAEQNPLMAGPPKDKMWIVPLGGIGEIGKNMMLLHYNDEILVIDAGLMFPTEDMLGIDIVIPDITYLLENKEKVKGIVLTHGHEDHIGAIPYIIEQINVPVYGTRLTLGLLRAKLREFVELPELELVEFEPEDRITVGSFQIDTFRMIHSITEGVGLAIHTPFGLIIHSGDFKFDDDPIDGKKANLDKLGRFGEKGVLLLLSDSTYAERKGHSASEKLVGKTLEVVFEQCKGRIITTSFASSIPRVQQVINCTKKLGRKICFLGRSLVSTVTVAAELGFLHIPPDLTFKIEELKNVPEDKVVILTTGSQGEPMSALTLMAMCNHKWVSVKPGDTVIISATPVPGNETLVSRTINSLFKLGADVVYNYSTKSSPETGEDLKIHVSGHANQDELKKLMNLVKPKFFIPIHGEYRHLVHHSRLAKDCGIDENNIFIIEDGTIVQIDDKGISVVPGGIPNTEVLVDGLGVGDIGRVVLKDRHILSNDGICVIVATIDKTSGELLSGPEIISRGFVYFNVSKKILDKAKDIAKAVLIESKEKQCFEMNILKAGIKEVLSKFFQKQLKRRPMIVPIILEI